jgi:hypothetical protein
MVEINNSLLHALAARYIWWRDPAPPSDDRIIAQVMNLGTWDDICRLEAAYRPQLLRAVMLRSAPGAISDRSWAFWRGRLMHRGAGAIQERPPRRTFGAEMF